MTGNQKEILTKLHEKFSENFKICLNSEKKELPKVFSLIKGIAAVGQSLKKRELQKHQIRCCNIFDEIFADISISVYLATNALDKPARIILRRAFELGIAVIYLWDMPHILYSWDIYEKDLNFSEMLTHLSTDGYIYFIKNENDYSKPKKLIDNKKANRIYGELSDIVHGKIKSFETELELKYSYNEKDWDEFINYSIEISQILLQMYTIRFNNLNEITNIIPSLSHSIGEYNNG